MKPKLPMRCTIQNRAAGTDAHGHANGAWQNLYTDVPCRLSGMTGDSDIDTGAATSTHKFFFSADQDVIQTYQIVHDSSDYTIELVQPRHNGNGGIGHIECFVKRVT